MRTLAIDFGTKRIGLALSDAGGKLATPYDVLEVSSPDLAIDPISKLIDQESVERIVVGLPLNMDGTIGPQARATISWCASLKKAGQKTGTVPFFSPLKKTGREMGTVPVFFPIFFVDERLSSFDAEQQLVARKREGEKITRRSKKAMLDALVAANLLQAFLDGKLSPIDVP